MPRQKMSVPLFQFLKILGTAEPSQKLWVQDPDWGYCNLPVFSWDDLLSLTAKQSLELDEVAAKAVRQRLVATAKQPTGCLGIVFRREPEIFWYLTPSGVEASRNPSKLLEPISEADLDRRYEPKSMWLRQIDGSDSLPKYITGMAVGETNEDVLSWQEYAEDIKVTRKAYLADIQSLAQAGADNEEDAINRLMGSIYALALRFLILKLLPSDFERQFQTGSLRFVEFTDDGSINSVFGYTLGILEGFFLTTKFPSERNEELDIEKTAIHLLGTIVGSFYKVAFGKRFAAHHIGESYNPKGPQFDSARAMGHEWFKEGKLTADQGWTDAATGFDPYFRPIV